MLSNVIYQESHYDAQHLCYSYMQPFKAVYYRVAKQLSMHPHILPTHIYTWNNECDFLYMTLSQSNHFSNWGPWRLCHLSRTVYHIKYASFWRSVGFRFSLGLIRSVAISIYKWFISRRSIKIKGRDWYMLTICVSVNISRTLTTECVTTPWFSVSVGWINFTEWSVCKPVRNLRTF